MSIKSISVLGLGLIGGSIAKAIKNNYPEISIFGYDTEHTLETALKINAIDGILKSPLECLNSDLIYLCMPVDFSISLFKDIIPHLKANQIITDVCSVKGVFEDIWNDKKPLGTYIGGHPMTGKEKGGFNNSDPLLFENSVYIVTNKTCNDFLDILNSIGARVTYLNAKLHDKVVSVVSHLPQLLSVMLVNYANINDNNIHFLDFAAGGFRDMTRIASSGYSIWNSIINNNRENITTSLDLFIEELNKLKQLLNGNNNVVVEELFEKAREIRDEIPKTTKGFLFPLHEIYVYVKDEPGVVSKISTVLYSNGINIKDIELLKIREGTGGTFRLSFESEADAVNAQALIQTIGYNTK